MDTYQNNEYWNKTQRAITPLFLYKPTHPVKLKKANEEIGDVDFSYMMVVLESLETTTNTKLVAMNFMCWEISDDNTGGHDSKQMSFLDSQRRKISHFITAPIRAFRKHEIDILKFENSPLSLKEMKRYTDKWKKASVI
jgi:hypothetical protein